MSNEIAAACLLTRHTEILKFMEKISIYNNNANDITFHIFHVAFTREDADIMGRWNEHAKGEGRRERVGYE